MNSRFQIVLWGLGTNGRNLADILGDQYVAAIIDSNPDKVREGFYNNIPVIDFSEYKSRYRNYFIVATPIMYHEIEDILKINQIENYIIWNKSSIRPAAFIELKRGTFISKFNLRKKEKILLCGVNLYSLIIYYYLSENGFDVEWVAFTHEQCIDLERLVKEKVIQKFQREIPETINVCLIQTDKSFQCTGMDKVKRIDCDAINAAIYKEWENDLKRFCNIHKGERVFIVATGPSIKVKDLENLTRYHEKTISMNSIYYIFDKTDWRPDYYVASDGLAIRSYEELENREKLFRGVEKFFSDNYLKFWEHQPDNTYHGFCQKQNVDELSFSEDFSRIVYSGLTVVYACLQLAVYMGFQEIFLLGCDFSFSENFDDPGDHFYNIADKNYVFHYDAVLKGYERAKSYADANGIKIYNATRGGKLEVFERVDFDRLFQ